MKTITVLVLLSVFLLKVTVIVEKFAFLQS